MSTFQAIVAEHVPAAGGACRVIRLDGDALLVEADAAIVAQELRLNAPQLLAALRSAPGGFGVRELRIHIRAAGPRV